MQLSKNYLNNEDMFKFITLEESFINSLIGLLVIAFETNCKNLLHFFISL